jgi:CHAT domain-containing protein/tetratricopeptide (TPR) repeat protein
LRRCLAIVVLLMGSGSLAPIVAKPSFSGGPVEASVNGIALVPSEVQEWRRQIKALRQQGRFGEAAALQERELAWSEKHYGPDHPSTATGLKNLAELYQDQGAYAKAETLYLRALGICEKVLGLAHPDTAHSLDNLALLYVSQGAYAKADPLFHRALAIREKALGADHPDTANSVDNLALLYLSQSNWSLAGPLFDRAEAIREKALRPDHPDTTGGRFFINPRLVNTGNSLNNLAGLNVSQGAYAKAQPLNLRALAIWMKATGADWEDTATNLNSFAELLQGQGRYGEAEILYLRAQANWKKVLRPDDPITATSLNSLAGVYVSQGAYAKAEPLLLRALAIREKVLGPDDRDTATSLNNLAGVYVSQGAYAKAEPLLLRVLAIRERGPDDPATATSLSNLAELYDSQGRYGEAEPLYKRSLAIREKALGPDARLTAASLINLAWLYQSQHTYAKANPLLRRGIGIQTLFLQSELQWLPQAEREGKVQALDDAWETAFTGATGSPSAAELALFSRLNRYGLVLEIERRQAALLRAPSLAALPAQIWEKPAELAKRLGLVLARLSDSNLPGELRPELIQERDDLESKIYLQLPKLRPQLVEPVAVARALPGDGVLVEFQRYKPFDAGKKPGQRWGAPRYLALLLQPDASVTAVDLGPASKIDPPIETALTATRKERPDAEKEWKQVADRILVPLLPHLAGRRQLFLSLDGELHRVPLAALPGLPDVQVRLLTSGRDLLRDPTPGAQRGHALVLSDPAYAGWPRLPATAREGRQVAVMLGADLREGRAASVTELQGRKGPRVIHVASYGLYENSPATADPMLASSIVLAGADRQRLPNRSSSAAPPTPTGAVADDGYLTALEAAQLQLDGTQLVVLSACDTGVGQVQNGEGIYGMQRALTVAGARSTLLSLWKVDDEATAWFMRRYYEQLKGGRGRMDALQDVQKEFRTRPKLPGWSHPIYWAAWQLTGDGDALSK